MIGELLVYTGVSTAAHISPVYKIRSFLGKVARIPVLGWVLVLAYSLAISWVVMNLFHFQSSIAGLANLLSGIVFTYWLIMEGKKAKKAKQAKAV